MQCDTTRIIAAELALLSVIGEREHPNFVKCFTQIKLFLPNVCLSGYGPTIMSFFCGGDFQVVFCSPFFFQMVSRFFSTGGGGDPCFFRGVLSAVLPYFELGI